MISRQELEPLLKYRGRASSPVLTLYLDVDLSRPTNRNRGIQVAARALFAALRAEVDSGAGAPHLDHDVRRVEAFLADYTPTGRSLVLFCDDSRDFFWHRTLPVALENDARYRPDPFLRPLLETLDEHERYAVVLLDRQQARLFSVALGAIEESRESLSPLEVRSIRSTGTDHLFSEKRFKRRADEHAHLHLKGVATLLRRFQEATHADRLVVAGPVEATSELLRLLPRPLRDRVVATWKLPIDTKPADLLRDVEALQRTREAAHDDALVGEMIDAARNGHQAVLGLDASLEALRGGRILRLLYVAGEMVRGGICRGCRTLLGSASGACPYCGGGLDEVRDLIGRMARTVSDAAGSLNRLHGGSADRLRPEGGVGAFLRF